MSGTSLAIVAAAGLCATALVALGLGPRRPDDAPTGPTGPTSAARRGAGDRLFRRLGRRPDDAPGDAPVGPTGPTSAARGGTGGRLGRLRRRSTADDLGAPASSGDVSTVPAAAPIGWGERLGRSRLVRRSLAVLTGILVIAAGVSISWPFWTDQYQSRLQVRLEQQLEEKIDSPEAAEEFVAGEVGSGDSLTRLKAPSIGVEVVVVEGTSQAALRAGAGHYPETALPCGSGNVAIAGHRTTFGKPFNRLDEIAPGDEITLDTPVGSCTYRVGEAAFVVTPDDVEVVAPTDTPRLTLTTCHPKGSARERLVLHADLVGSPLLEDRGGRTPPDIRGEA
ncbi:MAG TPA: sortase [Iamia sp.]|nr:sortase [Iamia sp.]